MEYVTLSNGVKMPILGYGVYQIPPAEAERCVSDAISVGYRLIDTAQAYRNEEGVGAAVSKSGLPREDFFITSKVWITNQGYENAKRSIEESLTKLNTNYIDLMLIHQPFGDVYGTYRAMEDAYKEGKLRAIGISNFAPDRFIDLQHFAEIKPMVNQIEMHVYNQQDEALSYMRKYHIQPESWGSFAEGKLGFFSDPTLTAIGKRHGKTAAHVGLRYLIERGVVVIPKSTHIERMKANIDVFDFSLSDEEKKEIAALDRGESVFMDHEDPKAVEWFMSIV
jgi:diketogulonate reductase-like aldo/keto reductase